MATGVPASTQQTSFVDLPQELAFNIFSRINLNEIQPLLSTNRSLNQIVSECSLLWKAWLEKRYFFSSKSLNEIANPYAVFRGLQVEGKEVPSNTFIMRVIKGHNGEVSGLKINQEKLISVGKDCCIKIWDFETETLEKSISFCAGNITKGMAIYQDKFYLASDNFDKCPNEGKFIPNGTIKVYNLKAENALNTGNEIALLKISNAFYIESLCTYENLLIVGYQGGHTNDDRRICIWDMDSDTPLHTIQLNEKQKVRCLAAAKNTLFSGHANGDIMAWDLKDYQYLGNLGGDSLTSPYDSEVTAMCIYRDKLIYGERKTISVWEFDQQPVFATKRLFLLDTSKIGDPWGRIGRAELGTSCFFTWNGLLFTSFDQEKIVVWDLSTQKKIWEHKCKNPYSLVMHRGKLFVGSEKKEIEVFDFVLPYQHEIKLLEALTNAKTKTEQTKIHTELLLLAFANKNRKKMLEYADKLLAIDPIYIELHECLSMAIWGNPLKIQMYEKVPFDHEVCFLEASFEPIEKALFDFTQWLETRNIKIDGPFKLEDPEAKVSEEEEALCELGTGVK